MAPEYIEVATNQGKLKGLVKTTAGVAQRKYFSFQGIPYAKPPVGELRFKPPQPHGTWEGVKDATTEGTCARQKHIFFKNWIGGEDCLYLNVYTPELTGKGAAGKAVMVWIHGGGFGRGSGDTDLYGPDFLLEEDVVVVTINYRLGVLGFLSLENEKVPGNAGLKDQTMALRWVQDNIQSFGGDPENVTIFGESAGGASVHYHLLSPLSRGLFHKAILQSGFALNQWSFTSKPRQKALLLARELGCTSQDLDKVLEFLMTLPAADLAQAQEKEPLITEKEKLQKFGLLFLPCVEVAGDAPFLSDHPRKIMERGEFAKVPVMMGVVDKEGLLALTEKNAANCDQVNADSSVMVPTDLSSGIEDEQKLGKEILQFYTGQDTLTWDVMHGYVDFISDVAFVIGLDDSRQQFLEHKTPVVYTYLFTYTSSRAFSSFLIPMAYPDKAADFVGCGASHGDELALLFKTNMSEAPYTPPTPEDQLFMNKFLKAWTTFAKTGNPNCPDLGETWEPDTIERPRLLELGKEFKSVSSTVFPKRMEFWKEIYGKYSYSY